MVTVVSFKYILPQFSKNESTFTRGTKLKENLSENTHKLWTCKIALFFKKINSKAGKREEPKVIRLARDARARLQRVCV